MAAVTHRSLNYHDPHQRAPALWLRIEQGQTVSMRNHNDIYNTTKRSHTGSHRLNVAHIGSTFKVVGIESDAAGHGAESDAVDCMAQTDAVDGV